jgi:hypothetical protein
MMVRSEEEGGEASMVVLIEVGKGETSDKVVDCSSLCCSSMVFCVGEPREMMVLKLPTIRQSPGMEIMSASSGEYPGVGRRRLVGCIH